MGAVTLGTRHRGPWEPTPAHPWESSGAGPVPGVAQPLAEFRKRAEPLTTQRGTWRLPASAAPGGREPLGSATGTLRDGAEPHEALRYRARDSCARSTGLPVPGWLLGSLFLTC